MTQAPSSTSSSKSPLKQASITLLFVFGWILIADIALAIVLTKGNQISGGKLKSVVQYFNYGRSVPGKLGNWVEKDAIQIRTSWTSDMLDASRKTYEQETAQPPVGPLFRFYGMSFSHHIAKELRDIDPEIYIDEMNGPGATPNTAYHWFLKDRPYRREGDVVVWTVLSSSVSAMTSLSRQTRAFEQPTPYTSPKYVLDTNNNLSAIMPLIQSEADLRRTFDDPVFAEAWYTQLKEHDALYTPLAYAFPQLDEFASTRMLRRSMAIKKINKAKKDVLLKKGANPYPYDDILVKMAENFVAIAREDGQVPYVLLIQTQGNDVSVKSILNPTLEKLGVSYLATEDIASPTDFYNYIADGHFTPEVDRKLAESFYAEMGKK